MFAVPTIGKQQIYLCGKSRECKKKNSHLELEGNGECPDDYV